MPISRNGPADVEAVRQELGESSADIATLCSSSKINKKAKYKPYSIGSYTDLTDSQLASYNYGLTIQGLDASKGYANMKMLPWTNNWHPPVVGQDWCRIDDYAGYNQKAGSYVHSVKIYTDNPHSENIPMGPSSASATNGGRIFADIVLSEMDGGITLADFSGTKNLYYTLLFGPTEGADLFDTNNKVWVAQSEGTVAGLKADGYSGLLRLTINVTWEAYQAVYNNANGEWSRAIVCLAPYCPTVSGTQRLSGTIDPSRLISLDMWNDGFVSTWFYTQIDRYSQPRPTLHKTVAVNVDKSQIHLASISDTSVAHSFRLNVAPLPEVVMVHPNETVGFSVMHVQLAVQLGSHVFKTTLYESSCSVGDSSGRTVLRYNNDYGQGDAEFTVQVPSNIPSGTYAPVVSLILHAYGTYYDSTVERTTECEISDDSDYLYDSWAESESGVDFPEYAVYSDKFSLASVTIS